MTQELTEIAPVEILDETGKTILQGQIQNCEREIAQFKAKLEEEKKSFENFKVQADLAEKVRQIQKAGFRKLPSQIQWQFEENPLYWELQDTLLAFKHRQERQVDESTLKRYEEVKKNLEESLKREEAKLAIYKQQLGE